MCDPISKGLLELSGLPAAGRGIQDALSVDLPDLPASPATPPTAVDPKVQAARQRERDKARAARGISSTILTGSGGLTTTPSTTPKTLLGQ